MKEYSTLILIIADAGPVRDGLHALMTSVPQVDVVEDVNDVRTALHMVIEPHPALVLLATGLYDSDMQSMVKQIKTKWPESYYVILVDNGQQKELAEAMGVDAVLLKGFPAAKLSAFIEKLLS